MLVATGRRPRTAELGLETLGLEPGKAVAVDDALQATGVDGGWLFAAGDVSGRTATTHQGKYDARVVGDVIAARFDPRSSAADSPDGATPGDRALAAADERAAGPWSRYRATADLGSVPQVVFSRPEVAWVGLTEAAARTKGLDVRVLGYDLENVAGASVFAADYAGHAQLVVDDARGVVVGATFVGPEVAELLHAATIAVVGRGAAGPPVARGAVVPDRQRGLAPAAGDRGPLSTRRGGGPDRVRPLVHASAQLSAASDPSLESTRPIAASP